jgi:hypothetical protein
MQLMKIVDSKRMSSVTVFEDTLLLGEVVGDVILNSGHLELKGKVLGNLYVRKGTCRMLGIVRSNLENEKDDVEVMLAPAPLAIEEMRPSVKPISNIYLFVFEHPCQLSCSTTSKFSYLDSHAVL